MFSALFFFYNHKFDATDRKKFFLYSMVLFLELMNIHDFSLGTLLERISGRIKFKLLLQLKNTLTKKIVEVKFDHGL